MAEGEITEPAGVAPGPELVAALAGLDLSAVADGDLVDVAAAWHRVGSWVLAQQQAALVEAAYRDADHPGRRLPVPAVDVADELRATLRLGRRFAEPEPPPRADDRIPETPTLLIRECRFGAVGRPPGWMTGG